MTRRKLTQSVTLSARLLLVALTLAALVVGGAQSANRLYNGYDTERVSLDEVAEQALLLPSPEEAAGTDQMADDGIPNGEPSAFFQIPAVVVSPNLSDRLQGRQGVVATPASSVALRRHSREVCVTACLIDADLGRQFTLVGAKPSGTM